MGTVQVCKQQMFLERFQCNRKKLNVYFWFDWNILLSNVIFFSCQPIPRYLEKDKKASVVLSQENVDLE